MTVSTTFQPFRDYTGYHHVLAAGVACVHPLNGNVYYWACEQKAGTRQNLTIYRSVGGAAPVQVVTFEGTVDAQSFITAGGCAIGQGGALLVATSLQPKGVPFVTETGFQGVWCRIPGVDQPWSMGAIEARLAAIEAKIDQFVGVLDAGDREALDRLKELLRIA